MIEDEQASDDDPPLACPDCGVSPNEGCEHLLALIDLTFGYCCGGYVHDHWDDFIEIVTEAFKGFMREGKHPDWDCCALHEVWEVMITEGESSPEEVRLTSSSVTQVIGDALWEADAVEIGRSLVAASGGRCESALRLLYATAPAEACERAKAILREWLVKERKKRTRRKKR